MSVAIGMPHPRVVPVEALIATNSSAGTTMPPIAAATGTAAVRGSDNSPSTSSRLISRPTTKKNTVIRPSLTTWCIDMSRPQPTLTDSSVCHRSE